MWYQFDEEKILVQQDDTSNKFWAARIDGATKTAFIRWGRIGTSGQSQKKTFDTVGQTRAFVNTKYSQKLNKGYRAKLDGKDIDGAMLDRLAIEASIVGTQNKCHKLQWVELTNKNDVLEYKEIDNSRLYDPGCDPGLLVHLETKKSYDGQNSFRLLFTYDKCYVVSAQTPMPLDNTHSLYDLTQKVEEAIGRKLC